MPDTFHKKIRAALENPSLQAALDGNAERRRSARHQAYASLPKDLNTMRQRAHAVRAQTIKNLDAYLEKFLANAQRNGLIIHRARDSAQAVQIVRDIAQHNQARLVVKSKTMVGEEIHLNTALEADGLRVVETDLGEYIVQLRNEPPAHIITPAVHLSRKQVGQTFQEKLGISYTEDIPKLTATARHVLRQDFLNADIGISGVNFGVAENGTLCLLTNEGNGRMVTTLPPVHIALMGMERLVPTLEDLALMLYLLPRSATGQQLTVYTSLIHGPRLPDEVDGPRERHLVLIDNNRSVIRNSPLAESLYCIRCGACLNACPVFRELGGHAYIGVEGQESPYPGPIGSVVSPGLFGQDAFGHLARASSLCGACKEACPVDIDLPKLLLRVRAGGIQQTPLSSRQSPPHVPSGLKIGLRLYSWFAASPKRFFIIQRLAGFASKLLSPSSEWMRLPTFTGWGYSRDFPRPAARPFRERFSQDTGSKTDPSLVMPDPAAPKPSQPQPVSAPSVSSQTALLERFKSELLALGGNFTACSSEQLGDNLLALLQQKEITIIQAWDDAHLPPGIPQFLQNGGIQVTQLPDPAIQAGLTGALAGVAETGSLLIPGGPGRPQTASLLPEIHIAILQARDIIPDLTHALQLNQISQSSSIVLVSGPSRTADIEMTLTIGVHGPKDMHIFCLEGPIT
jgi:L-lactate dehydrogenase complex protein LldF